MTFTGFTVVRPDCVCPDGFSLVASGATRVAAFVSPRNYEVTTMVLDVPSSARDLTLRITDQSDGLPDLAGVTYAPRSPDMAPFQIAQEYMPYPETTSVSRTFGLP
jgi:hypothetical protein